jgi:hypothetical protein
VKIDCKLTTIKNIHRRVDTSYTAVNDVHIFEEQTELVAQYDTSGYRPGQIKALISPEELEARTQAVSVLRRYSQAIGDLAAGKQTQTALRSLSPAPVAPTTAAAAASGKMTPQQMGLILSGLDAALTTASPPEEPSEPERHPGRS